MRLLKLTVASLLIIVGLSSRYAHGYTLNSELSTVSFATIKLSYVIEPAYFNSLTGNISEDGNLQINIPIEGIETGISIRNQRLNDLFFVSRLFPDATIQAAIPDALLNTDKLITQEKITIDLNIAGKSKSIEVSANIVKIGDTIAVSSASPVIVYASWFGIPELNLDALAKTVGGIPISSTVPVSFSLVFENN